MSLHVVHNSCRQCIATTVCGGCYFQCGAHWYIKHC